MCHEAKGKEMRGVISRARRCKPKSLGIVQEGSSPEQFDTEEKAAAVKVKKCSFCSEGRLEREERKREFEEAFPLPHIHCPLLGSFRRAALEGGLMVENLPLQTDCIQFVLLVAVVHLLLFMQFRSCDSIVSKRCVPGKLVTPACALT